MAAPHRLMALSELMLLPGELSAVPSCSMGEICSAQTLGGHGLVGFASCRLQIAITTLWLSRDAVRMLLGSHTQIFV